MPSGVYVRTKPRSLEVRKRISETLKGRPSPMKGRRQSLLTRQKIGEFNKGRIPYKMTDEIRSKISETKKGVPMSAENKAKIAASSKRGADHHNWKGGTGSKRHMAQERTEYKQWRTAVFQRDNYTCQMCAQYSGALHADHIERWADNEGLRYAVSNGRTLCVPCHYYITFKRKMVVGTNWCNFTMTKKEG